MKLNLKNLVVTATTAHFDFPVCNGMSVEIAYANKTLLNNIHESALVQKFDTETGAPYKDLDTDAYVKNYVSEVIKGWTGFTYAHLASLVLIDESDVDPTQEIDFDVDTAVFLMTNSPVFDQWVVSMAKRLDNFRTSK